MLVHSLTSWRFFSRLSGNHVIQVQDFLSEHDIYRMYMNAWRSFSSEETFQGYIVIMLSNSFEF